MSKIATKIKDSFPIEEDQQKVLNIVEEAIKENERFTLHEIFRAIYKRRLPTTYIVIEFDFIIVNGTQTTPEELSFSARELHDAIRMTAIKEQIDYISPDDPRPARYPFAWGYNFVQSFIRKKLDEARKLNKDTYDETS
jgi:hypothetical protein